ncbi:MAG: hypothetical protein SPE24_09920 [Erysipelotrichaceae bacterium]|nr:hypothetical protein [Erysipelotrichaceae bacterium]
MEEERLEQIKDELDKFIFAFELWNLLENNMNEVMNYDCKVNNDFTIGIGKWLNFLCTVSTLKDYLASCGSFTKQKMKEYFYKENGWLNFSVDLRNCAIHDFAIPKNYNCDNGLYYITFDELFKSQNKQLNKYNDKKNDVENRINRIKSFKDNLDIDYLSTKMVVDYVRFELRDLMTEVTNEMYARWDKELIIELLENSLDDKVYNEAIYIVDWVAHSMGFNKQLQNEILTLYTQYGLIDIKQC